MRASIAIASAIALAALATTATCGFAPEPDFGGKRVGDGIAPWTDLGPAQICLGNQYIGAPDTQPGGFCGSIDLSEAACASDGDCRSRESCVCGRCTVAYCSASSDCAAGKSCAFGESRCDVVCSDGAQCSDGEVCFNGSCRGRCHTDGDCQTGEVCNSRNYCAVAACADDNGCLGGERCRVQRTPRQALEPDPIPAEAPNQVALFVEIADPFQLDHRHIYRAVSADGRIFHVDPASSILDDGLDNRAPSVVKVGATWYLYYEANDGAQLKVASSSDGVHFGSPMVVLAGGAGPAAARAPSAVALPDGTVAVYYQIGDGAAIGLATGQPGGALAMKPPVLRPADVTVAPPADPSSTAPFWANVVAVRSPHAAITVGPSGPSLRLWYSAFGRESADSVQFGAITPIPPNFSIGYAAASIDDPAKLTPWPYGPVFDRVEAFLDHREELGPGVVQLAGASGPDDAYLLYYVDAEPATGANGAAGPFTFGHIGVLGNGAYAEVTHP